MELTQALISFLEVNAAIKISITNNVSKTTALVKQRQAKLCLPPYIFSSLP